MELYCGSRSKIRYKKWRVLLLLPLYAIIFFCIFNKLYSTATTGLTNSGLGTTIEGDDNGFKKLDKTRTWAISKGEKGRMGGARRLLGGPGSFPPRCNSKCGRCTPCKPVHVPVPPGTPVTTEYYPEAWRCKCGNKLYMP